MKSVILFDLDGTLTDSQEGITKSVQFALAHFGIQEPDLNKLKVFIGPPLRGQFKALYGFDDAQAEEAVHQYRKRYEEIGMYEASLYPYVHEILGHLKEQGYILALASSKNEFMCRKILKYFQIDNYFDLIGGASDDGRISEKAQVLQMVMERLERQDPSEYVLIGDTRFDALGAQAVGMDCIGVTFGFGTEEELRADGAIAICHSLQEVESYLGGK